MKPQANSRRPEKLSAIQEIDSIIANSDYCFVLNYGGLTVASLADLRARLAKSQSALKVVKNTYLAKALETKGWTGLEAVLNGPTALVTGSGDPNPLVAGKGISILKEHGIEVTEHVLKKECDALNEVFFHYITRKKPFVVMKYAMTLDGKIAAHTGNSKWVTGEEARYNVQADRGRYSSIMVGTGTVLKDDPLLTCRIPGGRNPVRIICDSSLRTPLDSRIAATIPEARTIIATCCNDDDLIRTYSEAGFEIIKVSKTDGHPDLNELMDRLYELKIDSILLEGGGRLNWSALKAGIVDKVQAYIAPKLFGGENARTPVEGQGVADPAEAFRLKDISIRHFGEDLLIEGYTVCLQE